MVTVIAIRDSIGRYGDMIVHFPVFEIISPFGWFQWDPANCKVRVWAVTGWSAWADIREPPPNYTHCRVVPRGEADASPMSRGQLEMTVEPPAGQGDAAC
jgi:hypothetical protein